LDRGERTSEDRDIEALARQAQAGCEASLRQLVERAQGGCEGSRNRLAEQYRERIEEYVYRLTLDGDLAEDIAQETIVEMFKVLGKLRRSELFWPWLRRIASNKTKTAQADAMRRRRIHEKAVRRETKREDSRGLANLVGQEMRDLVMGAMRGLKAEYRQVLTMRALEEMEYAEIAQEMGKGEFAVRMLFWRAKKALGRELGKAGLGPGALLTALVVFGKMTAKSEASASAVKVSAGSLAVGGAAATVGILTTTAGMVTTAAVMMAAAGSVFIPPMLRGEPTRENRATRIVKQWQGEAERIKEIWYYYPEGVAGPVLVRGVATAGSEKSADCVWVQNGWGNLYYDRKKNRLYQLNCRRWNEDLSVMRIPTDKDFSSQFTVHGSQQDMAGLLVKVGYGEEGQIEDVQWERDFNISREEIFQHPWSLELEENKIDLRDEIHKQGYAFVRVTGQIGSKSVTGVGRMPLVAGLAGRYEPWLDLEIDGESVGSSFMGLGRPWLGLHTIDVVRRDAAKAGMEYQVKSQKGKGKSEIVEIEVSHRGHREHREITLTYIIDMEKDWVEKIEFYRPEGQKEGEIIFTYSKDSTGAPRVGVRATEGMFWLFNVATEGTEGTEKSKK